MDLFMVFVTVFFIFICITQYYTSSQTIQAAIISPVPVLELSDAAFLFAIEEKKAITDSYCNFTGEENIKNNFCENFNSINGVSFLTQNIASVEVGEKITSGSLCGALYEFTLDGDELTVSRSGFKKPTLDLKSGGDNSKIKFDMKLDYELTNKYLLTRDACN